MATSNLDPYGRTLGTQTTDALQRYQNILSKPQLPYERFVNTPQFIAPTPQATQRVGYTDPYGRQGISLSPGGNQVVRNPRVVAPTSNFSPKSPAPFVPPTATLPVPGDPAITTVPEDKKPSIYEFGLGSVAGILGIGYAGLSTYNLITNPAGNLTNTGLLAGFANAIDSVGASTGLFMGSNATYAAMGDMAAQQGAAKVGGLQGYASATGQTTLTNAMGYGAFGGFVASVLGLGTNKWYYDTGLSLAGGAAGGAAGAALAGAQAGAWAGPVGAAIGGFVAVAAGGLVVPKPSIKEVGGSFMLPSGEQTYAWASQGDKYSAHNVSIRDTMFKYGSEIYNAARDYFGVQGGITQFDLSVGTNYSNRGGFKVILRDDQGQAYSGNFTDGRQALEFVGLNVLRHAKGLEGDVLTAHNSIVWDATTFQEASNTMTFAKEFRTTADKFLSGQFNVDQDQDTSMNTISSWEEKAKTLFTRPEDLDLITRAAISARSHVRNPSQPSPNG